MIHWSWKKYVTIWAIAPVLVWVLALWIPSAPAYWIVSTVILVGAVGAFVKAQANRVSVRTDR